MWFRQDGFDVADLFLNTLGHRQLMADRLELSLTVKANPEKRIQFAPYINALQRVRVPRGLLAFRRIRLGNPFGAAALLGGGLFSWL